MIHPVPGTLLPYLLSFLSFQRLKPFSLANILAFGTCLVAALGIPSQSSIFLLCSASFLFSLSFLCLNPFFSGNSPRTLHLSCNCFLHLLNLFNVFFHVLLPCFCEYSSVGPTCYAFLAVRSVFPFLCNNNCPQTPHFTCNIQLVVPLFIGPLLSRPSFHLLQTVAVFSSLCSWFLPLLDKKNTPS